MFKYNFADYKSLNVYFIKCFICLRAIKIYATIKILLNYLQPISLCCRTNWKPPTLLQLFLESQNEPSVARPSNFSTEDKGLDVTMLSSI